MLDDMLLLFVINIFQFVCVLHDRPSADWTASVTTQSNGWREPTTPDWCIVGAYEAHPGGQTCTHTAVERESDGFERSRK